MLYSSFKLGPNWYYEVCLHLCTCPTPPGDHSWCFTKPKNNKGSDGISGTEARVLTINFVKSIFCSIYEGLKDFKFKKFGTEMDGRSRLLIARALTDKDQETEFSDYLCPQERRSAANGGVGVQDWEHQPSSEAESFEDLYTGEGDHRWSAGNKCELKGRRVE